MSDQLSSLLDPAEAVARARAALGKVHVVPASPFAAANARARRWAGAPTPPLPLLTAWTARQPGSAMGEMRYRWDVSDRRCQLPAFAGAPERWRALHPAEQPDLERDPFSFEERVAIPILVAESCEYLEELATATREGDPSHEVQDLARELLDEADPVLRRDLATRVLAAHPWNDTFALFCLSRAPRALDRLRPIAVALATSYALLALRARGVVLGARFPFHEKPLVSATAHLAAGLWALGLQLPLVAPLAESVRAAQRPDGAWSDGDGPAELATTFVAADLLLHIDPSFESGTAARSLIAMQDPSGFFPGMGPDSAWWTAGVAAWLEDEARPFPARFRWPSIPEPNRDRKTGLPFFAYFDDLTRLFAQVPGIARAPTELAFFDLIGFRAFNNRYGQNAGDAVLAAFAEALTEIPGSAAIRDGGDEFLLVGAPGRSRLAEDLEAFRSAWPNRFRTRFGVSAPPVAARFLIAQTAGSRLREVREDLGRAIGDLKAAEPKR